MPIISLQTNPASILPNRSLGVVDFEWGMAIDIQMPDYGDQLRYYKAEAELKATLN